MRRRAHKTDHGIVEWGDDKSSEIHVLHSSSRLCWVAKISTIVLVLEYLLIPSFRNYTTRLASTVFMSSVAATRLSSNPGIPPAEMSIAKMQSTQAANSATTSTNGVVTIGAVVAKYYTCNKFEPNWCSSIHQPPLSTKMFGNIDFTTSQQDNCVGSNLGTDVYAEFEGTLQFPSIGTWTLHTLADDGSRLFVDGELLISGVDLFEASGTISIAEARQTKKIRVEYVQHYAACGLTVSWSHVLKDKVAIPPEFWVQSP